MSPYDIIKYFFNEVEWVKVDNAEKSKNSFLINRIHGIFYPLQANALNHLKIDPVSVVNYWKIFMTAKYPKSPGWYFTSTIKKDKIKEYSPPEEVSEFIRNRFEISNREIKELSTYFPKEFKKYCNDINALIKDR